MYRLEQLSDTDKIEEIYRSHMVYDFPKNELKPFSMIKKGIEKGSYEFYALYSEDKLYGYAVLVCITDSGTKNFLLDYFAVVKTERNKGIGSVFLKLLSEKLSDAGVILCEAENPDFAVSENDKNIMHRRINFYLRNGFYSTGLSVKLFGVEYVILAYSSGKIPPKTNIRHIYKDLYKRIVPFFMLIKFLKIH